MKLIPVSLLMLSTFLGIIFQLPVLMAVSAGMLIFTLIGIAVWQLKKEV